MAQQLKINVSFSQEEVDLFKFLKQMRATSAYIKDAVEFYRKYNGVAITIGKEEVIAPEPEKGIDNGELADLLNFRD